MIYASYRSCKGCLSVHFSNQDDPYQGFRRVRSTYHLENAIRKHGVNNVWDAAGAVVGQEMKRVKLTVDDLANSYLTAIAYQIRSFIHGINKSIKVEISVPDPPAKKRAS